MKARSFQSEESGYEELTWNELAAWWTHRPILRAPETTSLVEMRYAVSERGGRRGDPARELAGITLLYVPRGADNRAESRDELLAKGSLEVHAHHFPPSTAPQTFAGEAFARHRKPVIVRERAGRIMLFETPEANVDQRWIMWEEALRSGSHIQWKISSSPSKFEEKDAVAFVEGLVEW